MSLTGQGFRGDCFAPSEPASTLASFIDEVVGFSGLSSAKSGNERAVAASRASMSELMRCKNCLVALRWSANEIDFRDRWPVGGVQNVKPDGVGSGRGKGRLEMGADGEARGLSCRGGVTGGAGWGGMKPCSAAPRSVAPPCGTGLPKKSRALPGIVTPELMPGEPARNW